MADKTVGQVSVRVVPDTSKFRDDAKAKLAREEQKLPHLRVDINAVINEKGVVAQVRAVSDAAQRAVRDVQIGFNVDGLSAVHEVIQRTLVGGIVRIGLAVDSGSEARVKDALKRISADANIQTHIGVDNANFAAIKNALQGHLDDIQIGAQLDKAHEDSIKASLKAVVDQASAEAKFRLKVDQENLAALKDNIKKVIADAGNEGALPITLDTRRTDSQIANLQKRLEAVFGPYVDKGVDVPIQATFDTSSKDSIANAFKELENEIQRRGSKVSLGNMSNEILASIKSAIPEDFTMTVSAEPNISSLRRAQKVLTEFWAGLKAQELDNKIKLAVAFEQSQLRAEVNKVKADVAAELVELAVKTKFDFDKAAWHAKVAEAEQQALAQLGDLTVDLKVKPDPAKLSKAVDELKALLLRRSDLVARMNVELDGTAAAKLEVELAALNAKIGAFKVPVTPAVTAASAAKLEAEMKLATRKREIPIALKIAGAGSIGALNVVSVLSGWDALKNSIVNAHKAVTELFTDMPKLMLMVPAVLALSGAFLSAGANVVGLVGGLAQALPVLLALPGIAIGITVLGIAFGNLKKTMPDVNNMLKDFKASIQQDFWSAPVAGVGTVKDAFRGFLNTLVGAFGNFASTMGTFMGTLFALIQTLPLDTWFGNLSASIEALQGHMGGIANFLNVIGSVGSAMLVPLANLVGDLMTRFANWLTQMVADAGGIKAFADKSVGALSAIIETVIAIGNVFGGVFAAASAAGAASFQSLADHMNNFAEFIKDPAFQEALKGLFGAAFQMMNTFLSAAGPALKSVFGSLTTILTAVLPQVGTVLGQLATVIGGIFSNPEATAGLQAFISGILTGVSAIIPLLVPIGALIATLGPVLGQFATQIGTVFAALSPQIGELVTSIGPLVTLFGEKLANALTIVSPLIQVVIATLSEVLSNLSTQLGPVLDALLAVLGFLVPLLQALVPALVPLAPLILTVVAAWKVYTGALAVGAWVKALSESDSAIAKWAGKQLLSLGNVVAGWAKSVASAVASMAVYLAQCVTMAAQSAAAWVAAQARTLASLAVTAAGYIAQGAAMVASMAATVASVVAGWVVMAVQSMIQAIRMAAAWLIAMGPIGLIIAAVIALVAIIILNWDTIKEWTLKIFQGVMDFIGAAWDWIKGAFDSALAFCVSIIDTVFSFIAGMISFYVNLWLTVITAVWGFITRAIDAAVNFVSSVIDTVFGFISGMISFYVGLWQTVITTVWNAILAAIQWAVDHVRDAIAGLSQIAATIRGYFDLARQWAIDRLTALVDAVKAIPGNIMTALGNLGNLLKDAGTKLIQGLIDGINSMIQKVKDKLTELTDLLPDWKGPASKDKMLLFDAGQLVIDGFLNGLESRYNAVHRSLRAFTADVAGTQFNAPTVGVSAGAFDSTTAPNAGSGNTLNYYAAPGSSLGSEEDLFGAIGRARAFGW